MVARTETPTRAGPTKTVAWSRTAPVVNIGGEAKTFGNDSDQLGSGVNATSSRNGNGGNEDGSNSVGVYRVPSPRACRLMASSASDRYGPARSSNEASPPRNIGATSLRSVGGGAAHDPGGSVRFSASDNDGARYGTGVGVDGNGMVEDSSQSMAIEEKGEELRPAQAVMPAKVRTGCICF